MPAVTARTSFWGAVARFDSAKITPYLAFRNAFGMALPLAAGVAMGNPTAGLIACIGALNVSYSDGADPYRYRAWRMCAASTLCALAVLAGGLCAHRELLAVALAATFAFAAGLMVAAGTTAADIGPVTLVTFLVFSAHAMSPVEAVQSGALALGGGLLQTVFALALWPVHRYEPERRALAAMFRQLVQDAAAPPDVHSAPPASEQSTEAQTALAGLAGDRSLDAERYLALLSQAERIRLALMNLTRLRVRIGRTEGGIAARDTVERALEVSAGLLEDIAASLSGAEARHAHDEVEQLRGLAASLRHTARQAEPELAALMREGRSQIDAISGQLRSAEEMVAHAAPAGSADFARREAAQPRMLRLTSVRAQLRANLSLDSAAMRHALRLAACVAIGDVLSLAAGWTRAYWCPMTVAIVLKPDFTATFSRGILRVAGTLVGLGFATMLLHLFVPSLPAQVAIIAVFAFLLRCFGPANYGVFTIALTGLVVLLVEITGVPSAEVVMARGLNTIAGGAIALIAYAAWPTWERTRLPDELAQLFQAYRAYFDAVRSAYEQPGASFTARLDRARLAARRARSNLEASVARFRNEPGGHTDRVTSLDAILANSHRFIHAVMSLEAGLERSSPVPARAAFRAYAADTLATLALLTAALRGAPTAPADFPDLREDHTALVAEGDAHAGRYALVNVETDRITNSLNTISLEVLEWMGARSR